MFNYQVSYLNRWHLGVSSVKQDIQGTVIILEHPVLSSLHMDRCNLFTASSIKFLWSCVSRSFTKFEASVFHEKETYKFLKNGRSHMIMGIFSQVYGGTLLLNSGRALSALCCLWETVCQYNLSIQQEKSSWSFHFIHFTENGSVLFKITKSYFSQDRDIYMGSFTLQAYFNVEVFRA